MKRFTVLLLAFSLVIGQVYAASDADNGTLVPEVLFESDFENGLEASSGEIRVNNASVANVDGRNVLKADSQSGVSQFTVYADTSSPREATLVSFDMNFSKTTTRGYMDIFRPVKEGEQPSFEADKIYRSLYVCQDGRLSYFESFMPPCGTRVVNSLLYQVNQWYHYDMWIDYSKGEVSYFVDGVEQTVLPITDEFIGMGGFRMTVENMNGGAVYLFDNMRVVNFPKRGAKVPYEGIGIPENFESPVTIEYKTEENNLGFIFLKKEAEFSATFKNALDTSKNVSIRTTVRNDENRVTDTREQNLSLDSGEEQKLKIGTKVDKFGFYYLDTKVSDADSGELLSEQSLQFSVVNAPPEGLRNKRIGFTDHTADGHGIDEAERKTKLFADLGTGVYRIDLNYIYCPGYRTGNYTLDEAHINQIRMVDDNDMKICAILTWGKIPPVTDAEYKEWEKYVEEMIRQINENKAEGAEVTYEVWNEYNGAGFNYIGATSKDYVELLKHTYPVVKRLDPKAEVWGLVASPTIKPNAPQDAIDWVREVFEYGGGEYMDSACIHTYTHAAAEDFHTKRGMFLEETRELLDEFGYNDMEIQVSEMGWTTPGVTDEIGQASYIVRWAVMVYDSLDEIQWYCNQEKQTTSSHENGFGFMRTWSKGAAGNYPPYGAKPVLLSYANYNSIMTDAVFEKEIEKTENGTHMYRFKLRDGNRAVVAWNSSDAKETIALKLDAPRVTVYDLYGNPTELSPINGKYTMDISGCPIYIVGEFTECEKAEPELHNLTGKVETTENDVAYIHISNNTGKEIEIETDLPENITESARTNEKISFVTGGNSVENEKIHVRIKNKETGGCCYEYEIPVEYRDIVSYELKPSYYRNGRWQCILEIKNNKYSGSVSGTAVIKEPQELADETGELKFSNLLPRDVKRFRINVPQELAGAHMNAVIDLGLSDGKAYTDIKNSVYMTAMARMKKPPVIDGTLGYGEWNKSMPMLINNESQIRLQPDWSGPDDLSAKIFCAYDEDNFYIGAEVTDDVLHDEDEMARAWACDSIQFAFAKKNIASAARTEYGIALVNGVPKVDRYSFIGVNTGIINEKDVEIYEGVELQVKREGSRTIYEAKFPWEQIYGEETDVTRLNEVYFSVLVNENDGAGRNGWLEYCGGIGDSKNAALFIPVTLEKK